MDWKKVGNFLYENGVKRLGGFLANPVGEAADLVIDLVSGELGTDKPDEAMRILEANPDALLKLKQTEIDNKTELDRLWLTAGTERIREVNETMRVEAKSGGWWSAFWRPFWGVISALAFGVQTGYIIYLLSKVVELVNDGNISQVPLIINSISTVITALLPLWAVPGAILGVTAWHRGKMQREHAGEKPKSLLGAIAERISK